MAFVNAALTQGLRRNCGLRSASAAPFLQVPILPGHPIIGVLASSGYGHSSLSTPCNGIEGSDYGEGDQDRFEHYLEISYANC